MMSNIILRKVPSPHGEFSVMWNFFSPNLGKMSPKFLWERGRISAPENTKIAVIISTCTCRF